MTRLLVTGGTGFIGNAICQRAVAMGWDVTSLSLSADNTSNSDIRYISADITSIIALQHALKNNQFEYIVNCAGYIDHQPYFSGGRELINAHLDGLQNLLQVIDRQSLKSFVQIGSSDEYGGQPSPQVESMREQAIAPYSFAKVAATHLIQALARTENLNALILRFFLVYGPGQGDKRFLPQIIKGCLEGREFPVSEGNQYRDFLFIDDAVDAVICALQSRGLSGEVFNIASGYAVTIREMIETIQKSISRGTPLYGEIPYRESENMELWANVNKASEKLNWRPSTNLIDGIRKTISYYESL